MQEIALFLSSVAGIATAAAIRRFPKNNKVMSTIGANSHIKNQIHSLGIEKDILTKTISRLYQHDSGLSKIQRDRLLVRYQHQLGIVLAKMEKLEAASKHPDLGPVGDGLITLMDQKLSHLDQRLYEISSKLTVASVETEEPKQKSSEVVKKPKEQGKIQTTLQTPKEPTKEIKIIPAESLPPKPRAVEITTLTELPAKISEFPLIDEKQKSTQMDIVQKIEQPQKKLDEKIEILQSSISSTNFDKPEVKIDVPKQETPVEFVENKPKPTIKLPEEEKIDDDDDDLDKIKGEIMKTLSKLEQAEVE